MHGQACTHHAPTTRPDWKPQYFCRVQIPIRALPTNDEEDLWTEVQLTHKCVFD
jgi:hypothetical protein